MSYAGTHLTLFVGGPSDGQFVMTNVALDVVDVQPMPESTRIADCKAKPTDIIKLFRYVRREYIISGYAYIYYAFSSAGIAEEPDDLVQQLSRGRHYGRY